MFPHHSSRAMSGVMVGWGTAGPAQQAQYLVPCKGFLLRACCCATCSRLPLALGTPLVPQERWAFRAGIRMYTMIVSCSGFLGRFAWLRSGYTQLFYRGTVGLCRCIHSVPAVNTASSDAMCYATETVFGPITHSTSTCPLNKAMF